MNGEPPKPKFKPGDTVRRVARTADIGVVLGEARFFGSRFSYRVNFSGDIRNHAEEDLEICSLTNDPKELFLQGSFGDAESCQMYLTWLRVSGGLSNYYYSFYNSRTKFYDYQFKPLVKFLEGSGRVLLADEVGLGKTIEAGFVLLELIARRELNRAIIVCPAKLRNKWRREMLERFDLDFTILNTDQLAATIKDFNSRLKSEFKAILSYETIRSERSIEAIEQSDLSLDLLIADEAHHLRNSETSTHASATHLADRTSKVLLLSATPVNNASEDLFNLLRLLDPRTYQDFSFFQVIREANARVVDIERLIRRGNAAVLPQVRERMAALEKDALASVFTSNAFFQRLKDLAAEDADPDWLEMQRCAAKVNLLSSNIVRTRRVDVEEKRPLREPSTVCRDPHPLERALYDETFRIMMHYYDNFRLPVMNVERILSSCIPAFIRLYRTSGVEESWDDDEDPGASVDEGFRVAFRDQLKPVLDAYGEQILREGIDTKLEALLEAIKRLDKEDSPGCKIIIFSYFRRTIEYLSAELASRGIKNIFIHGGVPSHPDNPGRDERELRRQQFEFDPQTRVMLSSEVGSEGLDFQFAHIVVNYDLPWNPMRVEQRIGRVDRIGQKSEKILVYSLLLAGTVDDTIYAKLLGKIEVFRESIGDLEEILGERIDTVRDAVFDPSLTPAQREAQIEQVVKVMQNRMAETRELEENVAKIIGTDQYILDEIGRIQSSRRYVGPEEIQRLVHRTLEGLPYQLNITEDPPGIFQSRLNESTKQFLDNRMDRSRAANIFRLALDRKVLRWTFDFSLAISSPQVELLNLKHPAVRALCDNLGKDASKLNPTYQVEVNAVQNGTLPGVYLLLVYRVGFEGVYKHQELIALGWDLAGQKPIEETAAGAVLAQIINEASDLRDNPVDSFRASAAMEALEDLACSRFEQRRTDLEAKDRALLGQRREQILARARRELVNQKRRKDTLQDRIRISEGMGKPSQHLHNLLRGIEKNIERAEMLEREQLSTIPSQVRVEMDWALKSAGIVKVF